MLCIYFITSLAISIVFLKFLSTLRISVIFWGFEDSILQLPSRSLHLLPLFADSAGQVEYRVADDALAGGFVTVEEVSEAGSVPDLLVNNRGDLRVLFLGGCNDCRIRYRLDN